LEKLVKEGTPKEVQIVLGWLLNTSRLLVALPQDKFEAWLQTLEAIISDRHCLEEALESLEGQLNQASYVIPLARHILAWIRTRKDSRPNEKSQLCLNEDEVADLVLWKALLSKAHLGISMNLIVTRRPNRIVWSDSCPFGIGGFRPH
jgi:hypothetical protein